MNTLQANVTDQSNRIIIIVAQFNNEITDQLLAGAINCLAQRHLTPTNIIKVPGAVEIPFIANHIALHGNTDGIVALGAVIFGETDHYHYVANQVSQGCQQVALKHDIPVGFGVLTTRNMDQAKARSKIIDEKGLGLQKLI